MHDVSNNKKRSKFLSVLTYSLLATSTIFAILLICYHQLIKPDLFLAVLLGAVVYIPIFFLALVLSVYAIVQKKNKKLKVVAPLWLAGLVAAVLFDYFIMPGASSRIPRKMVLLYEDHSSDFHNVARYATDSLAMPDSGAFRVCDDTLVTYRIVRKLPYAMEYYITKDSSIVLGQQHIEKLINLVKKCDLEEYTYFQLNGSSLALFSKNGWSNYWLFIPASPFSEQDMLNQLANWQSCPVNRNVCLRFDGGATGHEIPFPYKTQFLRENGIDSLYIHSLFNEDIH